MGVLIVIFEPDTKDEWVKLICNVINCRNVYVL